MIKAVAGGGGYGPSTAVGGLALNDHSVTFRAYLQPNELQDLADALTSLIELQTKHGTKIRFNLAIELTADGELKPEATAELKEKLAEVSEAFH